MRWGWERGGGSLKEKGYKGGKGSVCYFILPAPARPGRTSWHMVGTVCPVLRTRPHKDEEVDYIAKTHELEF